MRENVARQAKARLDEFKPYGDGTFHAVVVVKDEWGRMHTFSGVMEEND